MKNKIAGILLAILALAAPLASKADLIFYDGFNYPDGDLSTSSTNLWVNFSGSKDLIVSNNVLQVGSTGGTLSRSGDENRSLPAPYTNSAQILYASFTLIATNLPNGAGTYFAAFYRTNASPQPGGFSGRINSFTNFATTPNTWRIGCTGNQQTTNAFGGGLPVDLALNTPYQVVARLDPVNLQDCTVWINPISEGDPSYSSSDSLGFAVSNQFAVNAFAFRQASPVVGVNNWFCLVTNLALATTFEEALTNVQPTNAVAPTIVTSPTGVTNFVGTPFNLSGVVNGQGQLSITYSWLKGGQPVSNPNGNSPIFPFPNPQIGDSGSYQLVATTVYGLSSTSAPAVVSISAAAVPPKITSGPDSLTAFIGQSVTFQVQVTSPGNLSFQWKSNNVDIPGANGQSFTLNNVQTNFSANYTVGVTNDVTPNGVLSTNAVLTVLPAQKTTIAFLRTLVDPGTFLPTNVPPTIPYSVTGVVTTFTNITSGDTASYYLQDATAGINIFVTFGSTFRPNQGDIVTFTGVLSSFGGLELDANTNALPQTSYEIDATNGVLPAPIVEPLDFTNTLTPTQLNLNLAGSLITITNVSFGAKAGTTISTTANQTVTVTNAAGQSFGIQFFDLDLDTAGKTIPAFAYSVTGVLQGGQSTAFTLAVTKYADIVTNVVVNPIPISGVLTNGGIVLSWSDPTFTLQSSTNAAGPYTNVPSAASPFTASTNAPATFFRLVH